MAAGCELRAPVVFLLVPGRSSLAVLYFTHIYPESQCTFLITTTNIHTCYTIVKVNLSSCEQGAVEKETRVSSTRIFETSREAERRLLPADLRLGGCYATATAVSINLAMTGLFIFSGSQKLKRQDDLLPTLRRPCVGCHTMS